MLASIVISAIILTPLISAILRMRGAARVPALLWVVMLLAAAVPSYVGWIVLNPGESISTDRITAQDQTIRLTLPPAHSLLLTAEMNQAIDKEDPNSYKTDYSLRIEGVQDQTNWTKTITGLMEREAEEKSEVKVESYQGKEISTHGKKRDSAGLTENIQDRFEFSRHGKIKITASNLQGEAVEALRVEIIPSPPSQLILWGIAILLCIFGIYYEAWKNCDKVAGDIGFMALYGVFLADGVTPLDGIKGVGLAALAAFFLAYAAVAGIAYLFAKYNATKVSK